MQTESEVASLNRKVQEIEENLEKSEERSLTAQTKLAEASQAADESQRMCKVLENRSQQDEERMDQLTNQLKEARMLAEDADGKSDEVGNIQEKLIAGWTSAVDTGDCRSLSCSCLLLFSNPFTTCLLFRIFITPWRSFVASTRTTTV